MPRRMMGRGRSLGVVMTPVGGKGLLAVRGLDRPQAIAMEAIILGKSMQEAADAAGVDRATLYRWRVGDPVFMGAMADWRREIAGTIYDRLAGLGSAAADAVQQSIEDGDGRLALRLLQGLRAMESPAAPAEAMEPHAVAYKHWLVTIHNPGPRLDEVEAFVAQRFQLSSRSAGDCTYRGRTIPRPLERREADAMVRELNDLGAYVGLRDVDVVRMADDLPPGYLPGPTDSFPPDPGPPAFFIETGDPKSVREHREKLRKRVAELEALENAEFEEEIRRLTEKHAAMNSPQPAEKSPG